MLDVHVFAKLTVMFLRYCEWLPGLVPVAVVFRVYFWSIAMQLLGYPKWLLGGSVLVLGYFGLQVCSSP